VAHIPEITAAEFLKFPDVGGGKLFVFASGEVETSGWSGVRLSQRFYVRPPDDGLLEFDLEGHPPAGLVLEVVLPVSAYAVMGVPNWFKGVKVYAAHGNIVVTEGRQSELKRHEHASALAPRGSKALVRQDLVSYDDSFNPIGFCSGFGHIHMKKLHHTLTLTIEGPDEARIRHCVEEATTAGLVAAIVAVYATGGGALSAAVTAFLSQLQGCLGDSFAARVDDHSEWIEWCT
jgi:hypothetical protein